MIEVRKISKKEIKTIYELADLTFHARKRMEQRGASLEQILDSDFAYVNTDGSINIAINDLEYFVAVKSKGRYVIITYKEPSRNGITVEEKYKLALSGHGRKR